MSSHQDRLELVACALERMGHSMAGPIQSLLNLTHVAARSSSSASSEASATIRLEDVQPHVQRLHTTLERFQSFAALAQGPGCHPLAVEATTIGDVIAAVVGEAPGRVSTHGVADVGEQRCLPTLATALSELLANALVHDTSSSPRPVRVEASCDGPRVQVSVVGGDMRHWSDASIAAEFGSRLHRFGLGLAIARLVAEQHGGRLETGAGVTMGEAVPRATMIWPLDRRPTT